MLKETDLSLIFSHSVWEAVFRILLILIIGSVLIHLLSLIFRRFLGRNLSEQTRLVLNKGIIYTGWLVIFMVLLSELGVGISTLLGAAGVLGIAIGIASQTSFSNIISGLFLVSEKTFEIGDIIRIGEKAGIVYSIDLLSVKLRTFDNLLIRLPNQQIISQELTNITKFPIRRMDFNFGVSFNDDLSTVKELLLDIAKNEPLCLNEPEPLVLFKDFTDHRIDILFAVWFQKANFLAVKNTLMTTIQTRFKEAGLTFPYPVRVISLHLDSGDA